MEDLAEFFKSGFQSLHKRNTFGSMKTTKEKMENINNFRRERRQNLINTKRKIDENMTPINTPEPTLQVKRTLRKTPPVAQPSNKRLEMLAKWKEEKEKRKCQEKLKAKPIFKVCHVPVDVGLTNLDNINDIKGKPIKKNQSMVKSKFAPKDFKFTAPANIKPINMKLDSTSSSSISKSNVAQKAVYLKNQMGNTIRSTKPLKAKVSTVRGSELKLSPPKRSIKKLESDKGAAGELNHKHTTMKLRSPRKVKVSSVRGSELQSSPPKRFIKKLESDKGAVGELNHKHTTMKLRSKTPQPDKEEFKGTKGNLNENRISKPASTAVEKPKENGLNAGKETPQESKNIDIIEILDSSADVTKENLKSVLHTPEQNRICSNSNSTKNKMSTRNNESNSSCKSASPDYPQNVQQSLNSTFTTPNAKQGVINTEESPVYVSPFVTISRGKNSARKEFGIRHSQAGAKQSFGENGIDNTSPQAGAEYFRFRLDKEIVRINKVCDSWQDYQKHSEIPEEAVDMIDVAIGQSKLLIAKKFQQFRGLIDQCKNNDKSEKTITCEDLHGFWDMLYMQVEDVDKRFMNLEKLKTNNWQEILPQIKVPMKRGRGRPANKPKATSSIRNLIRAARSKKSTEENIVKSKEADDKLFDGGYFTVCSPVKSKTVDQLPLTQYTPNKSARRSLRISVLNTETSRRNSSPGLTMMKLSQAIKCGDGLTPGKSILKTDHTRSARRKTKAVLFSDNVDDMSEKCKENDVNSLNLINFSPVTPTRRSSRLSKKL